MSSVLFFFVVVLAVGVAIDVVVVVVVVVVAVANICIKQSHSIFISATALVCMRNDLGGLKSHRLLISGPQHIITIALAHTPLPTAGFDYQVGIGTAFYHSSNVSANP